MFAFVSDVRDRTRWDDSADSEELTSPEPIQVGTTVRTRLRVMGREYQHTREIVEHEPRTRMKVESTSGPFPTTLAWQFDGQDGGTRGEASVTGRPTELMRLLQPLIARTTQQNHCYGRPELRQSAKARTQWPGALDCECVQKREAQ